VLLKDLVPKQAKVRNKKQLLRFVHYLLGREGLINIDYADFNTVFSRASQIYYGYGYAWSKKIKEGKGRRAGRSALRRLVPKNKFRSVILNISGGSDLALHEVSEAAEQIYSCCGRRANIIFGAVIDKKLKGKIRVDVVGVW